MSERERWIVYPLLFFALGASLRDKILQHVEAKEIVCERLRIVNQTDPTAVLAELSSKQGIQRGEPATRTYLRVDELLCEGVHVADREDPSALLVVIGSSATPLLRPGEPPRRSGFVQIRDDVEQGQVSELRADQLIGNRIVARQLLVLDPIDSRPLVYAGTEATAGVSLRGEEPAVSYQGVIYLNNKNLGLRLAPPRRRTPVPRTPPVPTP